MSPDADIQRAGEIRRLAQALNDAIAEAVHGGLLVDVSASPASFAEDRPVVVITTTVSKPL